MSAGSHSTGAEAGLLTHVLLLRHGETDWNADGRIQGHTDIALNARGLWQAERLAAAVVEAGMPPLEALYCSDLLRTRQTATPLARLTGLPLVLDTGLRERAFGTFEGRRFAEIEAADPEATARWRKREPGFGPPGGETLAEFDERVQRTARALCRSHPGGHVALVAHGGVLDCLYRAATGTPLDAPRTWTVGNACINRLMCTERGFVMLLWGDDRHLQDEAAAAGGPEAADT